MLRMNVSRQLNMLPSRSTNHHDVPCASNTYIALSLKHNEVRIGLSHQTRDKHGFTPLTNAINPNFMLRQNSSSNNSLCFALNEICLPVIHSMKFHENNCLNVISWVWWVINSSSCNTIAVSQSDPIDIYWQESPLTQMLPPSFY